MRGDEMYGIHDLGGLDGFGPVDVEEDEPYFHEPWERRQFAVAMAAFSIVDNGSRFRHSIERMDPAHYLSSSYYEHWTTGFATALVEMGHLTREELEARAPGFPLSRPVSPLAQRSPAQPAAGTGKPRFAPGDAVRVRQWQWPGHTRCPRYVQGRRGTVVRVDVVAPLPDVEAHGQERPCTPTYSVRIEARELWGERAERGAAAIHVDLWEPYLEPLDTRARAEPAGAPAEASP
jgi:nitrile hydratase